VPILLAQVAGLGPSTTVPTTMVVVPWNLCPFYKDLSRTARAGPHAASTLSNRRQTTRSLSPSSHRFTPTIRRQQRRGTAIGAR
jgi:hypothetical protein